MKIASIFILNLVCVFSLSIGNLENADASEFIKWKERFGSFYLENSFFKPHDQAIRDFYSNLLSIQSHNLNINRTYDQGLNEDSFMTFDEKKIHRMGAKMPKISKRDTVTNQIYPKTYQKILQNNRNFPENVNYSRFFGPIKNQGVCLSCWAITAIEVTESILRRKKRNWNLSSQNLVDCSKLNYGCNGGWAANAYSYIKSDGLSNGSTYVYVGTTQTCKRVGKQFPPIAKIGDFCSIFLDGNEEILKRIVAVYGPVSVAISTTSGFTNYRSGVFSDVNCRNHTVDHAVTLVGYGKDKLNGDYWIIRNSWGSNWGINGYGLMLRNRNNACGIALYVSFPCQR